MGNEHGQSGRVLNGVEVSQDYVDWMAQRQEGSSDSGLYKPQDPVVAGVVFESGAPVSPKSALEAGVV